MSPFHPAITSVGKFVASFHPKALPPMLRASFARELAAWWLLPIMLGAVEGGAMGNIVKKAFEGLHGIRPDELDLIVATVQAGPAVANISSFLWASLSHGKTKVKLLPLPRSPSTRITPPDASMIALAIDRPSPDPRIFVPTSS